MESDEQIVKSLYSAVYTGIKKPESFSHSGFSLKVARQLPLNTCKKKTPPQRDFWNSAEISLVFCQCKRSLQSRRYYSGFWSRGTWPSAESPDRGPRRNAHYTCTVKGREKSRMRTTYQNTSMRFWFFRTCAFRAKNPECCGFFWQCKRYSKKTQVFWILVFANVNGPNVVNPYSIKCNELCRCYIKPVVQQNSPSLKSCRFLTCSHISSYWWKFKVVYLQLVLLK